MSRPVHNVLLICLMMSIYITCDSSRQPNANGEALAKSHCASCHQYPDPALLDRESWRNHILPRMGYVMGVLPESAIGFEFIETSAKAEAFSNPQLFRSETTLSIDEWEAIQNFYLDNAPTESTYPTNNVSAILDQFNIIKPGYKISPPSTTMVRFIDDQLVIGDAHSRRLYQFDKNLHLLNAANVKEGLVDITSTPDRYLATVMGSFAPTDTASGLILSLPKSANGKAQVIIDSLRRPVDAAYADLDGDGSIDIITCEFAKWTGELSWWSLDSANHCVQHIIRDMPGATKAYPYDWNKDELMDIIALFGQGDEGIFIFYNQGDGLFETERILEFPASFGSSSFRLIDYNQDGHPDIIYTAGDNADFPPIYKPYHGIYIYLNNGNNDFEESVFYPLPGAYDAIPADYDGDGDLDIAAIAFFPNYNTDRPLGFIYLDNNSNNTFEASTFSDANIGRWIVMDAADWDSDGDIDLVLGSLAFETVPEMGHVQGWTDAGIPFVILENNRYRFSK